LPTQNLSILLFLSLSLVLLHGFGPELLELLRCLLARFLLAEGALPPTPCILCCRAHRLQQKVQFAIDRRAGMLNRLLNFSEHLKPMDWLELNLIHTTNFWVLCLACQVVCILEYLLLQGRDH